LCEVESSRLVLQLDLDVIRLEHVLLLVQKILFAEQREVGGLDVFEFNVGHGQHVPDRGVAVALLVQLVVQCSYEFLLLLDVLLLLIELVFL